MGTRLSDEQMPRMFRAPHPDVPLGFYAHTLTGGQYLVVGGTFTTTSEEGEVMVHYIHREKGYSAHRTVSDFLATIFVADADFPRFRHVGASMSPMMTFLHFLRIVTSHPLSMLPPPDKTTAG